jgi:hypothetical protein
MTDTPGSTADSKRLIVKCTIAICVLIAITAFLTNPDQAAHLKALKETISLKYPYAGAAAGNANALQYGNAGRDMSVYSFPLLQYHNYGVFSTTGWSTKIYSYGYFGKVQTTNDIAELANQM